MLRNWLSISFGSQGPVSEYTIFFDCFHYYPDWTFSNYRTAEMIGWPGRKNSEATEVQL